MPVDMSNPTGFNQFWEDTVGQFRSEAIDNHLADGDNLEAVNDHVVGPIDEDQLAAQSAYPWVWSVAQTHSPAYSTTRTDQGTLQMQVLMFAEDTNPKAALDKARFLLGRVVNNVEGSALVDSNGVAHASQVLLQNFQLDIGVSPGNTRAQVRSGQATFGIEIERDYNR